MEWLIGIVIAGIAIYLLFIVGSTVIGFGMMGIALAGAGVAKVFRLLFRRQERTAAAAPAPMGVGRYQIDSLPEVLQPVALAWPGLADWLNDFHYSAQMAIVARIQEEAEQEAKWKEYEAICFHALALLATRGVGSTVLRQEARERYLKRTEGNQN